MNKGRLRLEQNLNREWKFTHGDIQGGYLLDYDDSNWYDIGLPHTFSMPYWGESEFYVGYGFYRKEIEIASDWKEKNVYLEFGAAFQHAEIYVNGHKVGEHKGGYTAFIIDITDAIQVGKNLVAVRLNNLWSPTIAPRSGEHTFCGGLYRDVKLIVVNPVHTAWYGTFITTPQVSHAQSTISIQTEIENTSGNLQHVTIQTDIFDDNEKLVTTLYSTQEILAQSYQIITQHAEILNPVLWTPECPTLYTAYTTLLIDNQIVDDYQTAFGIRWFEFTKDKGFFLNGEHCYLQGANVHQDHAGWGDAVTHAGIYRDIKMMKDCGMNFIRGSHYPHHTVFADECDRQGLFFWSELCFWGIGGFVDEGYWFASAFPTRKEDYAGFEESCVTTLKEMIRQNRNHPSIITWSMGNEIFFTKEDVMDDAKALVKKLVHISHEEDPTRPASVGGVQRCGFDVLGDIAGYNGDGAVLFKDPGFPSLVAEYGSVAEYRPGQYSLNFSEGSEENYSWRSGRAIWCGFHHGSIANIGNLGIVDLYRLPLRSWYCYREALLGIKPPKWPEQGIPHHLEISADRTSIKNDGTEDCQLIVKLCNQANEQIANTVDVTLHIIEGPGYFPTGKELVLSQSKGSFIEGIGSIEFRSYYAGKTIIEAKATGVESGYIEIITTGADDYKGQEINLPPLQAFYKYNPLISEKVNLAKNRPSKVSSERDGFLRAYANNETDDNYWLAEEGDRAPWWQIDLENLYHLTELHIQLATLDEKQIVLENSEDGSQWSMIIPSPVHVEKGEFVCHLADCTARYLKVSFSQAEGITGIKKIEVFN